MVRKAIVAEFGESWIELLSLEEATEKNGGGCCGSSNGESSGCGSAGCECRLGGRPFRSALPENLDVKKGDTVEVSISGSRAAAAFLFILGLPLVSAAAGWHAVRVIVQIMTERADAAEAAGVLGAAVGFLLGIGILLAAGSRNKRKQLPVITAVVKP